MYGGSGGSGGMTRKRASSGACRRADLEGAETRGSHHPGQGEEQSYFRGKRKERLGWGRGDPS